ncbi:TraR/DksA family transcriptional regulator [Nitrosophilus kaiyonis]|uniref:TraR/DksA family transcriptional regulator n=1 Tax=Nitrosophilus kaiyonis TaxID=2930200 RepID=UPI002493A27F|nr:hypothetical protein [Nitrosophilus kaiyonis]
MTQEQLNEFKEILEKRKKEVENELKNIRAEVESMIGDDAIDDMEDMAVLENTDKDNQAIIKRLEDELKDINEALLKIKQGTYGKCKDGSEISIDILYANPLHKC